MHVPQSLASIDFNDFEPALESRRVEQRGDFTMRSVAQCPLFTVEQIGLAAGKSISLVPQTMHILAVVSGDMIVESVGENLSLRAGEFCLVPASVTARVKAGADASFLRTEAGR